MAIGSLLLSRLLRSNAVASVVSSSFAQVCYSPSKSFSYTHSSLFSSVLPVSFWFWSIGIDGWLFSALGFTFHLIRLRPIWKDPMVLVHLSSQADGQLDQELSGIDKFSLMGCLFFTFSLSFGTWEGFFFFFLTFSQISSRPAGGEVIGIDLGTTNSCVSVMEGKVCFIQDFPPLSCCV